MKSHINQQLTKKLGFRLGRIRVRPNQGIARRHAGVRPIRHPRLGNQVFPEPKPDLVPCEAIQAPSSIRQPQASKFVRTRHCHGGARRATARCAAGPCAGPTAPTKRTHLASRRGGVKTARHQARRGAPAPLPSRGSEGLGRAYRARRGRNQGGKGSSHSLKEIELDNSVRQILRRKVPTSVTVQHV